MLQNVLYTHKIKNNFKSREALGYYIDMVDLFLRAKSQLVQRVANLLSADLDKDTIKYISKVESDEESEKVTMMIQFELYKETPNGPIMVSTTTNMGDDILLEEENPAIPLSDLSYYYLLILADILQSREMQQSKQLRFNFNKKED